MSTIVDIDRDRLVAGLKELEPRLRAMGVTHLAIYGSRSRGDNRPDSDIDVLVDVSPAARFSLLDLIGVQHVIGDATGLPTQATMRRSIEPAMAARIAADTIEIF